MPVEYPETTATKNVSILHHEFLIDALQRTRRIWIYLPTGYHESRKKYPVIYMHDGQNLFDAHTSYVGEWGVDKIMNMMEGQCIIIGIDNGGLARL
ncbi:MAG: alpha/beta hydrolase-fold protein, partial [Chitinophagaceae bacterium]